MQKQTQSHQARRDFFKVSMPIHIWDGGDQGTAQMVAPGQYQFPFRAALPASLPGSMRLRERHCICQHTTFHNCKAAVEYKVRAEVVRGSNPGGGVALNLVSSAELPVRPRRPQPPAALAAEASSRVRRCGCCAVAGRVSVRIGAASDAAAAGEKLEVLLEVDNRTDLAFPEVLLELERELSLSAGEGRFEQCSTVASARFPGLMQGASYLGANAQRLPLQLPPSLAPTCTSPLVRCAYRLRVTLCAGPLFDSPSLAAPLTVTAAPPPRGTAHGHGAAPPDFWKPQMVTAPVDVALPDPPMVPPKLEIMTNPVYAERR